MSTYPELLAKCDELQASLDRALDLLNRLRDDVDALDGTSVGNEKLVDDYREFMGPE